MNCSFKRSLSHIKTSHSRMLPAAHLSIMGCSVSLHSQTRLQPPQILYSYAFVQSLAFMQINLYRVQGIYFVRSHIACGSNTHPWRASAVLYCLSYRNDRNIISLFHDYLKCCKKGSAIFSSLACLQLYAFCPHHYLLNHRSHLTLLISFPSFLLSLSLSF